MFFISNRKSMVLISKTPISLETRSKINNFSSQNTNIASGAVENQCFYFHSKICGFQFQNTAISLETRSKINNFGFQNTNIAWDAVENQCFLFPIENRWFWFPKQQYRLRRARKSIILVSKTQISLETWWKINAFYFQLKICGFNFQNSNIAWDALENQ